ncbi:hypothetical protein N9O57_00495 [bacterium]|nr:hypothetical protein [bacterium]
MKILTLLTLCTLISCSHTHTSNIKTDIQAYKESAQKLISLNNSNASEIKLKAMSLELISKATPIINSHKKRFPKCSELMDTITSSATKMTNLTLEQIEKDYHEGAALPKADDSCYEAKELIVHPATVAILTKTKLNTESREQINEEIEEVLAHIDMLAL